MKTYLFLLATLWSAVQFGAAGQTALTLSAEETQAGRLWQLTVGLDHAGETDITAFQMDIQIPEGFAVDEASLRAGTGLDDHDLSSALLSDGRKFRVVGFSLSNAALNGESPQLFALSLRAEGQLAAGSYAGQVSNIVLAHRNSAETSLPAAGYTLQCSAQAEPTYTLTYLAGTEVFATQTYHAGETVAAPDGQPAREDYDFAGWDGLPATMPDHDLSVEALFTPAWETGLEGTWYLRMDALSQFVCHDPAVNAGLAFVGTDSPVQVQLEATAEGYRICLEGQNEYLGLAEGETFFSFGNTAGTFRFFADSALPAEGSVRSFFVKANGAYLSTQGNGEGITEFLALAAEPASWSLLTEEDFNIVTAAPATAASPAATAAPHRYDLTGRRLYRRPARGLYLENGQKRVAR